MTDHIHDALVELLVRRMDYVLSVAQIIDWAVDALVGGIETPALVVLAGFSHSSSMFEVEPWFSKTLDELGIGLPAPDELRRAYVGVVSRAVLGGSSTPEAALELVHRYAVSPMGHPTDLMPWCYVWEGLAPSDFQSLDATGIERETLLLAAQWSRQERIATRGGGA